MSTYDTIKQQIQADPALTQIYNEATQSFSDYVKEMTPLWGAEDEKIKNDAIAAGQSKFALPFRIDSLIAPAGPAALEAFMLTQVEFSMKDGQTLEESLLIFARLTKYRCPARPPLEIGRRLRYA